MKNIFTEAIDQFQSATQYNRFMKECHREFDL